ncbi:GA module-containing protein [Mycoplasma simbae]|uniref:GA module-containing protein n=1 Tax=Mycoplasma simbae TaxID=36744 RepID=UPI000495FC45|nr:GA module-containing protein [Mycoplasma simbae]
MGKKKNALAVLSVVASVATTTAIMLYTSSCVKKDNTEISKYNALDYYNLLLAKDISFIHTHKTTPPIIFNNIKNDTKNAKEVYTQNYDKRDNLSGEDNKKLISLNEKIIELEKLLADYAHNESNALEDKLAKIEAKIQSNSNKIINADSDYNAIENIYVNSENIANKDLSDIEKEISQSSNSDLIERFKKANVNNQNNITDALNKYKDLAKKEIETFDNINNEQKQNFKNDIQNANSIIKVKEILDKAKKTNNAEINSLNELEKRVNTNEKRLIDDSLGYDAIEAIMNDSVLIKEREIPKHNDFVQVSDNKALKAQYVNIKTNNDQNIADALEKYKVKAKDEIDNLQHLNINKKAKFKDEVAKANGIDEIKEILNKARNSTDTLSDQVDELEKRVNNNKESLLNEHINTDQIEQIYLDSIKIKETVLPSISSKVNDSNNQELKDKIANITTQNDTNIEQALDKYKAKAKEIINNNAEITQNNKKRYSNEIDHAQNIEQIKEILRKVDKPSRLNDVNKVLGKLELISPEHKQKVQSQIDSSTDINQIEKLADDIKQFDLDKKEVKNIIDSSELLNQSEKAKYINDLVSAEDKSVANNVKNKIEETINNRSDAMKELNAKYFIPQELKNKYLSKLIQGTNTSNLKKEIVAEFNTRFQAIQKIHNLSFVSDKTKNEFIEEAKNSALENTAEQIYQRAFELSEKTREAIQLVLNKNDYLYVDDKNKLLDDIFTIAKTAEQAQALIDQYKAKNNAILEKMKLISEVESNHNSLEVYKSFLQYNYFDVSELENEFNFAKKLKEVYEKMSAETQINSTKIDDLKNKLRNTKSLLDIEDAEYALSVEKYKVLKKREIDSSYSPENYSVSEENRSVFEKIDAATTKEQVDLAAIKTFDAENIEHIKAQVKATISVLEFISRDEKNGIYDSIINLSNKDAIQQLLESTQTKSNAKKQLWSSFSIENYQTYYSDYYEINEYILSTWKDKFIKANAESDYQKVFDDLVQLEQRRKQIHTTLKTQYPGTYPSSAEQYWRTPLTVVNNIEKLNKLFNDLSNFKEITTRYLNEWYGYHYNGPGGYLGVEANDHPVLSYLKWLWDETIIRDNISKNAEKILESTREIRNNNEIVNYNDIALLMRTQNQYDEMKISLNKAVEIERLRKNAQDEVENLFADDPDWRFEYNQQLIHLYSIEKLNKFIEHIREFSEVKKQTLRDFETLKDLTSGDKYRFREATRNVDNISVFNRIKQNFVELANSRTRAKEFISSLDNLAPEQKYYYTNQVNSANDKYSVESIIAQI